MKIKFDLNQTNERTNKDTRIPEQSEVLLQYKLFYCKGGCFFLRNFKCLSKR